MDLIKDAYENHQYKRTKFFPSPHFLLIIKLPIFAI
ncbi:hypothetical protein BC624_10847 [Flavobacterium granuli]|uniref:Uncharacterized protein n=1 Tax=Flavobacterium granuli TaxID=280093 RepID=A0A1M5R4I2_9FLAO|nr:hypothetical protein BC624_10847 [Flavobacterium granuli]SHH21242.1 hypothetical protein SAMN05443373_10946 [Flavobacterium granuli]